MNPPRRIAVALSGSAVLVIVGLVDGGCNSSSNTAPPAPPCALPPGVPQNEFCSAVAAFDGRCGHCADCTGKNLQKCDKQEASISAALRAAIIACKDTMSCDDYAWYLGCVPEQMQKAVPTAAQKQAKDAYCTACNGTNAAACAGFFDVNAPSAGKHGAGYSLFLASDATAARALTLCSSKCDPFDYGLCVGFIRCGEAGGDFCVDSGFCAPQ